MPTADLVRQPTVDLEQVLRAQAGERGAWDALVRAQEPSLLRLAGAILRDSEDARDVCQEALRRAFEQLNAFDTLNRFELWLRRIVINCARDLLRRRGVRRAAADELSRLPAPPPPPEDVIAVREDRERLQRALARLPIELREALVAHLLEDRDYRELAEILDLSVNAVRIRVHRALARMRELLKEMSP